MNTRRRALRVAPVALGLAFALSAAAPAPLAAQPTTRDRAWNLAANGAIGGVAAAARAAIAGKDPVRAFARGVGGGLLVGAGRQVAASHGTGAGLIGRQISALGISAIVSASADTAALLVPVGPLKLWVVPRSEDRLRPRLNVGEMGAALYYLLRDDIHLDGRASLSVGTFVFRHADRTFGTPDGDALGRMDAGVVLLGRKDEPYDPRHDVTLSHEAVHVLQLDFGTEVLTSPVERWAVERLFGSTIAARIDAGLLAPALLGGLNSITAYVDRPWEQEASRLAEIGPPALEPALH